MKLDKIIITRREAIAPERVAHGDFVYDKRLVVAKTDNQCAVAFMDIAPGKSAYPRHYHFDVTEVFYVISGNGRVETPEGDKPVSAGDVIVFPPGAAGAHRIWNTSESESLRYIDFDTTAINDLMCYPDSRKIGFDLNGKTALFFREEEAVDYYEGE
ncbi:MAG: cupin domain-containing protein [Zoogloeaceae bacterium]|jgi:uncharacterized cupin superfamily protein|nr:cupin domain-containing protein [Zoogloeaceae bacterium]